MNRSVTRVFEFENLKHKNGHNSSPKPFQKVIIGANHTKILRRIFLDRSRAWRMDHMSMIMMMIIWTWYDHFEEHFEKKISFLLFSIFWGPGMVLDGPNVDSKLPKAARRASGMPWGPRSERCAPEKYPTCYFGIFPPRGRYLPNLHICPTWNR